MIKRIFIFLLYLYLLQSAYAQTGIYDVLGKISYISAQNIYVRFDGTNNLQLGDSIFVLHQDKYNLLFVVESRSTLSCMGTPVGKNDVSVGEEVYGIKRAELKSIVKDVKPVATTNKKVEADTIPPVKEQTEEKNLAFEEKIRGRLSVSSYSGFSENTDNNHRMRYTFSLKADHIGASRLSVDSYLSFTHRNGEWNAVKENIFNALKIYNLALKYNIGSQSAVWVGRKINPNLSNIGAIDGLQFETKLNNFSIGAAVGFRPDYEDYSMNTDLLEYGVYLAHELAGETGVLRNSLAFFEQQNNGKTDRRFAYFQHSNTLLKDLFFFVSSELDLYKLENDAPKNTVSMTAFYASLRYRIIKQLSFYVSYDARRNVIYYETFKSMVDRLLEEATRQGAHLRINYRPSNKINIGLNTSYRTRNEDIRPTKTLSGFVTFSSFPWFFSTATISTNMLQTNYLDGKIAGLRLYKDMAKGKIYSSLGFRYVDYDFYNSILSMNQYIAELDLTWRVNKKFSISANYEGTFEKEVTYNMLYLNLIKRF